MNLKKNFFERKIILLALLFFPALLVSSENVTKSSAENFSLSNQQLNIDTCQDPTDHKLFL